MPLREEAQIINQLKLTKIDKLLLLIANYAGNFTKRVNHLKWTISKKCSFLRVYFREDMVMLTILYRNKIVIFDTPLWNESSLQLVKRREIPFDQTPQVISILSTGELMTGNSQVT